MSEGVAVRERRGRATSNCRHRWVIETPNGATSRGMCKRCGATKRFPNAAQDAVVNPAGGLGRWSGRRQNVRPKEISLGDKNADR